MKVKKTKSRITSAFFIGCFGLALNSAYIHAQNPTFLSDTRIEVDEEQGEIRFFIDGKLEAIIKADGFEVKDSITYGGAITDSGPPTSDQEPVLNNMSAEGNE